MNTKYAAALNDQGRFANTKIGDFTFIPEVGAHLWKGQTAETAAQLADQVNGAVASLLPLADPFLTLRVVQIGPPIVEVQATVVDDTAVNPDSVRDALLAANHELNAVIRQINPSRPSLKLREEAEV